MSVISPAGQRACLAVPGSDKRKLEKARTLAVDEIVVDLEDAVAPADKHRAREVVTSWLPSSTSVRGRIAIRVNVPGTPWCHRDLEACVALKDVHSIVVPKVESPGDLEFVDRLLDGLEAETGRERPLRVQALIETATGLSNLIDIVTSTPRLESLVLGYADLAASLGRAVDTAPSGWSGIQDAVLIAGRRAGLAVIDGPFLGVAIDDAFRESVRHAARAGFDGKWVIHPRQAETATAMFTPTAEEVDWAARVVDALRDGHSAGVGAIDVDGQMIDEAVAAVARRVLSRVAGAR